MSVVRTGSVLAYVAVQYYIEPNGDAKFYGGTSVIYFSPGDAVKKVTVIAKDDGIPQVVDDLAYLSSLGHLHFVFSLFCINSLKS